MIQSAQRVNGEGVTETERWVERTGEEEGRMGGEGDAGKKVGKKEKENQKTVLKSFKNQFWKI